MDARTHAHTHALQPLSCASQPGRSHSPTRCSQFCECNAAIKLPRQPDRLVCMARHNRPCCQQCQASLHQLASKELRPASGKRLRRSARQEEQAGAWSECIHVTNTHWAFVGSDGGQWYDAAACRYDTINTALSAPSHTSACAALVQYMRSSSGSARAAECCSSAADRQAVSSAPCCFAAVPPVAPGGAADVTCKLVPAATTSWQCWTSAASTLSAHGTRVMRLSSSARKLPPPLLLELLFEVFSPCRRRVTSRSSRCDCSSSLHHTLRGAVRRCTGACGCDQQQPCARHTMSSALLAAARSHAHLACCVDAVSMGCCASAANRSARSSSAATSSRSAAERPATSPSFSHAADRHVSCTPTAATRPCKCVVAEYIVQKARLMP
jgi:hypothetical protein